MKRIGYLLVMLVMLLSFGGTAFAEGEGDAPAVQTGWVSEGEQWKYIDPQTNAPVTGWLSNGGRWYLFDDNGIMLTGWQQKDGEWYYMNSSGTMQKGWIQLGTRWYYLKPSGAMATGWQQVGSTWYYMNSSGTMQKGWQQIGGKWYYLKSSGAMLRSDWLQSGKSWYYMDSSGAMVTGTKTINGKTYKFNNSGAWIQESTNTSTGGFADLAPTTRMNFQELVGDNGNYAAIKSYPAKGTYKIVVDLYHQVVMAYKKDSKGNYTVPVRYMVTTTGGPKTPTPTGTFSCKDSRRRFSQFSTGEYAQYWTRVVGEIYFHSLLYTKANANTYMESSYRLLGSRGSHGCIRLLVPDARWIYYNIAPGTTVQIRSGSASDTATANIKKQLTRPALPKTRPNCNGVGSTDNWSIK